MAKRTYSTLGESDVLIAGIPSYMANSIDPWLRIMIESPIRSGSQINRANEGKIRRLERKLRTPLGSNSTGNNVTGTFMSYLNQNEELKLDAIQAILEDVTEMQKVQVLDTVLRESGSKWTARMGGDGKYGLEERVDDTTTAAYEDVISSESNMSVYLKKSWDEAFGREPDSSASYSDTVRAVEAATWPHVLPLNDKATLGDIIRELDSKKNDWKISVTEKVVNSGIENIVAQLRIIWQGQTDRHGTSDPIAPTQQAAEQAIFMGIELCQLFSRGLVLLK